MAQSTRTDSGMAQRSARVLRAEVARAQGQSVKALGILGENPVPLGRLPRGSDHALAHERFLRAELLREVGRQREALKWYATFPDPEAYDLAYLPAAMLRRAELYGRMGDRSAAKRFYARFAELWRDADPELQPLRAETLRKGSASGG